ncbi:hypothetical protein JOH50_004871 [Rhizobium leguminosarum]|nr:hypothetical protein [Rhizobium leguminosarum]
MIVVQNSDYDRFVSDTKHRFVNRERSLGSHVRIDSTQFLPSIIDMRSTLFLRLGEVHVLVRTGSSPDGSR